MSAACLPPPPPSEDPDLWGTLGLLESGLLPGAPGCSDKWEEDDIDDMLEALDFDPFLSDNMGTPALDQEERPSPPLRSALDT